jgi:hypothetical protein
VEGRFIIVVLEQEQATKEEEEVVEILPTPLQFTTDHLSERYL